MRTSIIQAFLVILMTSNVFAQSQLVINDNAFIVLANNVKLVIENPNPNAITTAGTGGNIITESELNQVVWKIGTTTGTYVMPFTSNSTFTKIPFTAAITTAGTGSGELRFSTYSGANWDNDTYRPSDVTQMYDFNSGTVNNSDHVIDRFWIIDPLGYTTVPEATFTFTYRDVEHTQVGNAIVETDLAAQRFNSLTSRWGDYLPQGTTNTATNTTSGVPVTSANFFRSWTLSELTNPLAIDLVYFVASCKDQTVLFNWETSYQFNTDHFEIEHYSTTSFDVIGTIPSINGPGAHSYTYETAAYRTGVFRLVEIDGDGNRIPQVPLSINCTNEVESIVAYNHENNSIYLQFEGEEEGIELLQLFDATGRLVYSFDLLIQNGINATTLPNIYLTSGFYHLSMKNGMHLLSKSILNSY